MWKCVYQAAILQKLVLRALKCPKFVLWVEPRTKSISCSFILKLWQACVIEGTSKRIKLSLFFSEPSFSTYINCTEYVPKRTALSFITDVMYACFNFTNHSAEPFLESCKFLNQVPRLLWNPGVHYRFDGSPPLVLVLSETNPARVLPPYFVKIRV